MGVSCHRRKRHWKTEIVAASVEMLSGRRKKDYAADALAAQGDAMGLEPADVDDGSATAILAAGDPEADEMEVAAVA